MMQVQNMQETTLVSNIFGSYILREYEKARKMRQQMKLQEIAREKELFQVIDDYVEQA